MKYLIDSSAWIEYLEGGQIGSKVSDFIEEKNEIIITAINIGEIISKIKRKGKNWQTAYESLIKNSKIIEITPKIAREAGLLHASTKEKIPHFSLADAIIIKAAQSASAKILTTDNHFKDFKEAIVLN